MRISRPRTGDGTRFVYGLASHAGDWRRAQTDWQAQRLNQPLIAFESSKHPGRLGKTFSILRVNNESRACARAEEGGRQR